MHEAAASQVVAGTTVGTVVLVTSLLLGTAPVGAAPQDWGLNGTYTATSNGDWTQNEEVLRPGPSTRSTWTITTECSYPTECTGTVTSDSGWEAAIFQRSGVWYVKRTVEGWGRCPQGVGLQEFRFWPWSIEDRAIDTRSTTLIGEDRTTGRSGDCGVNKPLFISTPFKLVRTGP